MRWRPKDKTADQTRKWRFPLLPITMDDGLRVMWEWVSFQITITSEWADVCEGYTEYWAASGFYLGKVFFRS